MSDRKISYFVKRYASVNEDNCPLEKYWNSSILCIFSDWSASNMNAIKRCKIDQSSCLETTGDVHQNDYLSNRGDSQKESMNS